MKTLPERVSEFLAARGVVEEDGPPRAYFFDPTGVKHEYQTVSIPEAASADHAANLFIKWFSRALEGKMLDEVSLLMWRARPRVEVDDFGLHSAHARFVLVDPKQVWNIRK